MPQDHNNSILFWVNYQFLTATNWNYSKESQYEQVQFMFHLLIIYETLYKKFSANWGG